MAITQDLARRYSAATTSLRGPSGDTPVRAWPFAVTAALVVVVVTSMYADYATNQRMQAAAVCIGFGLVVAAAPTLRAAAWSAAALAGGWIVVQVLLIAFRGMDMPPPVSRAVG